MIKRYKKFGIGLLIMVFISFNVFQAKADYLYMNTIQFDPDQANHDDDKGVILYDAYSDEYYFEEFGAISIFEITNVDWPDYFIYVDYIFVLNSDENGNGIPDEWYMDWIKLKDGSTVKKTCDENVHFGEIDDTIDHIIMAWTVTGSGIAVNSDLASDVKTHNSGVQNYYYTGDEAYLYGDVMTAIRANT
ncbi:MAG: hypothetical protein ACFE9L_20125 [Candidatus Hodarchaeota archaeon]